MVFYREMERVHIILLVILAFITAKSSAQDSFCSACNCQFNNVEALDRLIGAKIASRIGSIGATYVRWGRSICPNVTGTELLYAGRAGGTFWNVQGGGAEKLCLPGDPDYIAGTTNIATTISESPHIHGTEYEYSAGPLSNLLHQNVPCAVCYASTRSTALMIPGKTQCPSTWTREYFGYLTSERQTQPGSTSGSSGHFRSSFDCVDVNAEAIAASDANEDGALFYYVVSACSSNGLECPPYEEGRALSCVVCTK